MGVLALAASAALAGAAPRTASVSVAVVWLGCVAVAGATAGIGIGGARVDAIDGGALTTPVGNEAKVRGYIASFPHRSQGRVDVIVETPAGRVMVETPEPAPEFELGAGLEATGTIRAPPDWQGDYYERLGVARVLATPHPRVLQHRRGGLAGAVDGVRRRSEAALETGTSEPAANLLRGFVLGEDDRIDEATRDRFKRSGLAHLLAVSGQNVVLLAILGAAVCALLGVSLRGRLLAVLLLIAVYVPLTGAGASIQRAGVMGAAGVVAALAGRPASRWYALLLAAAATLAMNPRASGDIGWQLSFAAVLGILCFCGPLARVLAGPEPSRTRRALSEAAALTISATLATAPLTSFHFETLSLVALPANLLAVPAEAPVMWLGMLGAAAGQVSWLPVAPLTGLAGLLAGYIDQVAAWTAGPGWAQVDLGVGGLVALGTVYVALAAGLAVGLRSAQRRVGLRPSGGAREVGYSPRPVRRALAGIVVLLALAFLIRWGGERSSAPGPGELRVDVLDVGQGDAILLRPAGAPAVLVDTGPPGSELLAELDDLGVDALGALVVTHTDLDHIGGATDVLARVAVGEVLFARIDRPTRAAATAAGAELERIAAGARLRAGPLDLDVLWPPPTQLGLGPPAEPNSLALVMLARWHGFRMLLTADAEAELAPVEPGDVDVLKVAHHGSDDAGLAGLLARSDPELAVISVGADNTYGHPTPASLATIAAAGVPVLRTDLVGTVEIAATRSGWSVVDN